jgi:hydrogenase maturation protease
VTGTPPRVLVIGVGNPDRGDDGVGALVIPELRRRLPADVAIAAVGSDALNLIREWANFDAVICIDACAPATSPGRIQRLNPATDELLRDINPASSHALGLREAIGLARALGHLPDPFIIFAVEGRTFARGATMSPQVAAAMGDVVAAVSAEVEWLRAQ